MVYWFVYVMIGLYLLAPFITPWLNQASKRQIEFFLTIWLINSVIPWIQFFSPQFIPGFQANGDYYWMFCYFGGFLGYWIMGYYLNNYPISIGFNSRFLLLSGSVIIYPIGIYILKKYNYDTDVLTDGLSTAVQIGTVGFVAMLYPIFQNIKLSERLQRLTSSLAKYSFGIYLTHLYIARELYWGVFSGAQIHIFPKTFLIALLTLCTGYLLTLLISKLPYGKYVTGSN